MTTPTTDKYEIIQDDYITMNGRNLYRTRALRNIPGHADKGDLGGYVGGLKCLSQEGDCWIYPSAMVFAGAEVHGNAVVAGHSRAIGGAIIKDSAVLAGNAHAIGKVVLAGSERLDRDSMLLNVSVVRRGQYAVSGNTIFTFLYQAEGFQQTIGINIRGCDNAAAQDLSVFPDVGQLAMYQSSDGVVNLFSAATDVLEYAAVLESLR
jgi:hypothetical protein